MKKLFNEYRQIDIEKRKYIEDLYILHELEKQLDVNKKLDLSISQEEIIFVAVKRCLQFSNIKISEIISRLLEILECRDITVYDIQDLSIKELVEILTKDKNDFKRMESFHIISNFECEELNCVLMQVGEKYFLVYKKKDAIKNIDKNSSFEEILHYVLKNKLI